MRFALIVDEADDFYRTNPEQESIKMEEQLRQLEGLTPVLKFEVTATLLAIFVALTADGKTDNVPADDIFYVEASQEYVGPQQLRPPTDSDGHDIFLDETDLTKANVYVDAKVKRLWKAAVDHKVPAAGHGPLILDATAPGVSAVRWLASE
eukprot:2109184-Pleurochrysis_carterae.AAC.1